MLLPPSFSLTHTSCCQCKCCIHLHSSAFADGQLLGTAFEFFQESVSKSGVHRDNVKIYGPALLLMKYFDEVLYILTYCYTSLAQQKGRNLKTAVGLELFRIKSETAWSFASGITLALDNSSLVFWLHHLKQYRIKHTIIPHQSIARSQMNSGSKQSNDPLAGGCRLRKCLMWQFTLHGGMGCLYILTMLWAKCYRMTAAVWKWEGGVAQLILVCGQKTLSSLTEGSHDVG